MHAFVTITEKAKEWGVSARYVQALCKKGMIEGADKRGGVWLIPATAKNPTKKAKPDTSYLEFYGTKKEIFVKAVELFALKLYENVTMKDIAHEARIGQSSVYNHFKSKQEILDTIYGYYCHYYPANRPALESFEPIMRYGNLLDIVNCVNYEFAEGSNKLLIPMAKIIFQRVFVDQRAREISLSLIINDGIAYMQSVFDRAVEVGRLAPFDTRSVAEFISGNRLFVLYRWLLSPSDGCLAVLLDDLKTVNRYAVQSLTELAPPNMKNEGLSHSLNGRQPFSDIHRVGPACFPPPGGEIPDGISFPSFADKSYTNADAIDVRGS